MAGGLYRPQLLELIAAVRHDPRFELHISRAGTGALLVTLPFHASQRRHLRTHFPSKLIEYTNHNRPIVVWGPASSSTARWASSTYLPALHCDLRDPTSMLDQLADWLAERASQPSQELDRRPQPPFDPEQIHSCFEESLTAVLERQQRPRGQRRAWGAETARAPSRAQLGTHQALPLML